MFILNLLKKMPSDVGLFYIGKGPMLNEVKQYIIDNNLTERVFQADRIDNNKLKTVYDNSDVFILPTEYEIYGMVIMEALQYGVPCVSTPEAGPQTILKDERLGCCVPLDIDVWAEKINYYFYHFHTTEDKLYRKSIVDKNYRWKEIAKVYHEVLYKLVDGEQMLNGGGKSLSPIISLVAESDLRRTA